MKRVRKKTGPRQVLLGLVAASPVFLWVSLYTFTDMIERVARWLARSAGPQVRPPSSIPEEMAYLDYMMEAWMLVGLAPLAVIATTSTLLCYLMHRRMCNSKSCD